MVITKELKSSIFTFGIRFYVILINVLKNYPLLAVISSYPTTKTNLVVDAFSIIFLIKLALRRLIEFPLESLKPAKS